MSKMSFVTFQEADKSQKPVGTKFLEIKKTPFMLSLKIGQIFELSLVKLTPPLVTIKNKILLYVKF